MLNTSKTRYAVRMTSKQGKFLKDLTTGNWTTYQKVPSMSRSEAEEIYSRCLLKNDGSRYEVVDLDIQDGLEQIAESVRVKMWADCHYSEKPKDWLKSPDGEHFLRMMNHAINEAKQKALVQYIVSNS